MCALIGGVLIPKLSVASVQSSGGGDQILHICTLEWWTLDTVVIVLMCTHEGSRVYNTAMSSYTAPTNVSTVSRAATVESVD